MFYIYQKYIMNAGIESVYEWKGEVLFLESPQDENFEKRIVDMNLLQVFLD